MAILGDLSAGTATCYLSGVKSNYEVIGVNAAVSSTEKDCKKIEANHVTSIMEMARRAGKAIGVVRMLITPHTWPLTTTGRLPVIRSIASQKTKTEVSESDHLLFLSQVTTTRM